MAEDQFQAGDVVQLKSGGPEMTVSAVLGLEISCVWFVKNQRFDEDFPAVVLKNMFADLPLSFGADKTDVL
ncbi:DUF2158 domain-containing protein [Pararhizobium sp. BT-229]|uniref:YodC family protein n=1 Tax=Pararhizobium sp. BT-229 TaxID=2986923 RepID=UPI0021F76A44|nr:DUF2158 domain-containing protein [Pararhizobium sp. BT-229]MCV9960360.1 DUF2158 domain-containing protein [Pararhizobium sp. BT-229]